MRYQFQGVCPYCGQAILAEAEDARDLCVCPGARRFRKLRDAIRETMEVMQFIDAGEEAVDFLLNCAHMICAGELEKATVHLQDGSRIMVGDKVTLTAQIKREIKI